MALNPGETVSWKKRFVTDLIKAQLRERERQRAGTATEKISEPISVCTHMHTHPQPLQNSILVTS